MCGLNIESPAHLDETLAASTLEVQLIKARHAAGGIVAAYYSSVALPAAAGVLDGREATITWMLGGWFSHTFPKVKLDMERAITFDGNVLCAGSLDGYIPMALELVRHFLGDELAQTCANVILHDSSRYKQSSLMLSTLAKRTRDGVVFKAKKWLEEHIDKAYDLEAVALASSVSTRTLLRHFQEVVGDSPLGHLQTLRIERARQLLEITVLDLSTVAEKCGYRDTRAFRRLFKSQTGISPAEYRQRYAVSAEHRL
ncbi:GlxA family transcriptional regulator [Noviherbaspirillum saxi]|uniref:GlxA family transcriptional regulator n=1 Tax=Noviherbaspirillum saxi TaxID=2320863 RepID=UPI0011C4808B|nr:helix-turn-helix domain-containing protein [Noviherbaspirillum saxi]